MTQTLLFMDVSSARQFPAGQCRLQLGERESKKSLSGNKALPVMRQHPAKEIGAAGMRFPGGTEPCPDILGLSAAWVDGHQQCLFSVLAQMVWATSSRLGCALGTCANVRVWGSTWRHATLLVCNYAIK